MTEATSSEAKNLSIIAASGSLLLVGSLFSKILGTFNQILLARIFPD